MSGGTNDLDWDTVDIKVQVCDLASAASWGDAVILRFGARDGDTGVVRGFAPRLVRQIALRPASARHLRDMLARAVGSGTGS
jgi:hypothetical protein